MNKIIKDVTGATGAGKAAAVTAALEAAARRYAVAAGDATAPVAVRGPWDTHGVWTSTDSRSTHQ